MVNKCNCSPSRFSALLKQNRWVGPRNNTGSLEADRGLSFLLSQGCSLRKPAWTQTGVDSEFLHPDRTAKLGKNIFLWIYSLPACLKNPVVARGTKLPNITKLPTEGAAPEGSLEHLIGAHLTRLTSSHYRLTPSWGSESPLKNVLVLPRPLPVPPCR